MSSKPIRPLIELLITQLSIVVAQCNRVGIVAPEIGDLLRDRTKIRGQNLHQNGLRFAGPYELAAENVWYFI
jgi:hypothetical protein